MYSNYSKDVNYSGIPVASAVGGGVILSSGVIVKEGGSFGGNTSGNNQSNGGNTSGNNQSNNTIINQNEIVKQSPIDKRLENLITEREILQKERLELEKKNPLVKVGGANVGFNFGRIVDNKLVSEVEFEKKLKEYNLRVAQYNLGALAYEAKLTAINEIQEKSTNQQIEEQNVSKIRTVEQEKIYSNPFQSRLKQQFKSEVTQKIQEGKMLGENVSNQIFNKKSIGFETFKKATSEIIGGYEGLKFSYQTTLASFYQQNFKESKLVLIGPIGTKYTGTAKVTPKTIYELSGVQFDISFPSLGENIIAIPKTLEVLSLKYIPAEKLFAKSALSGAEKYPSTQRSPTGLLNLFQKSTPAEELAPVNPKNLIVQSSTAQKFSSLTKTGAGSSESPGLYVSPAGRGSPAFLRVENETPTKLFSLQGFFSPKASPTVLAIEVEQVKRIPEPYLSNLERLRGVPSSNKQIKAISDDLGVNRFLSSEAEKGIPLISPGFELGKTEIEAIIPPGSKLVERRIKYGTIYEGTRVRIQEFSSPRGIPGELIKDSESFSNILSNNQRYYRELNSTVVLSRGNVSRIASSIIGSKRVSSSSNSVISSKPITSSNRIISSSSSGISSNFGRIFRTNYNIYSGGSTSIDRIPSVQRPVELLRLSRISSGSQGVRILRPPYSPPRLLPPRIPPSRPPTINTLKFRSKSLKFKKVNFKQGFNVFFKTTPFGKGEFKQLNLQPVSYEKGLELGINKVGRSVGRTFELRPAGRIVESKGLDLKPSTETIYRSKKNPNRFIEKTKYAINTPGEIRGLKLGKLRSRGVKFGIF
jgi:hypothetical protein